MSTVKKRCSFAVLQFGIMYVHKKGVPDLVTRSLIEYSESLSQRDLRHNVNTYVSNMSFIPHISLLNLIEVTMR